LANTQVETYEFKLFFTISRILIIKNNDMKNYKQKSLLTLLFLFLSAAICRAYSFKVDGIYYTITSSNTVEVTCKTVYCQRSEHEPSIPEDAYVVCCYELWDDNWDWFCEYYISDYSGYISIPEYVYYDKKKYDVTRIGRYAFVNCSSVSYVSIPTSVTEIYEGALYGCTGLSKCNIPSSVTYISNKAFYGCSSMQTLTIPSSVSRIGAEAFVGCTGTVTINSTAAIHWSCVYMDEGEYFTEHHYPMEGSSFSKVVIENSTTRIEDMNNGEAAFRNCKNLTSVILPNTLTYIGSCAFEGCSNLTTIAIPSSVENIGSYAFYNSGIKAISSKADVTPTCSNTTFYGVDKSIPVYVTTGNMSSYQAATGWKDFTNIAELSATQTCGKNLAWALSDDGTLTISGTGDMYSFSSYSSAPWYSSKSSIKKVVISVGVTSISKEAFYEYSNLKELTIPSTVTNIGDQAFRMCSGLESIQGELASNDHRCVILNDTLAVFAPSGLTSYIIPNSITSIRKRAFFCCSSLTSISIPSSVTYIGEYAFSNCSSLSNINIPENLTSIPEGLFDYCTSLKSIDIPENVRQIGSGAFWACSALSSISLPEGLKSIGGDMFWGCYALKSMTIPSTVTYMGDKVLVNSGVKTLTVNCNIGYGYPYYHGWFYKSPAKDVIIGEDVTCIDNNAFYGSAVETINIPAGVTQIGSGAFRECASLSTITSMAQTPPECPLASGVDAFYSVDKSKVTLYVPKSSLSLYQTTSPWSDFGTIDYIRQEIIDGEAYSNNEKINNQTINYTRTFTNTNWQALYIPFSMSYSDWCDNFDVARINDVHQYDYDDDGEIDATAVEIIKLKNGITEPNTPYLIKAKEIGEKTISVSETTLYATEENSHDVSSWNTLFTFTGTYNIISGDDMLANGYYSLGNGTLHQATSTENSLKPFRWYMSVTDRNGNPKDIREVSVRLCGEEDLETGVISPYSEAESANDSFYNLIGCKTQNPQKGIYVKNGKMIFIK